MRVWLACWFCLSFAASQAIAGEEDVAKASDLIGIGEFESAVELLSPAVAAGNPDALMLQGILCESGAGVPKDGSKARDLWERAALAGQTDAAKLLLPRLDNQYAREWWRQRIAKLPESTIHAPKAFVNEERGGLRVITDAALKWIQRASAKGNAIGLYNAYQSAQFHARMNPSSMAKVRELLVRAADAGLLEALMELSSKYEQSIPGMESYNMGFAKDRDKAASLMKRAAETGDAGAQLLWAHWLSSEKRQFKDKASAVEFYRLSSAQGNSYAAYFLSEAYGEEEGVAEDRDQSEQFLELAATRGNDFAVKIYARRLFTGKGMPSDQSRAIRMLERSVVTSILVDVDSLNLIAFAYATGAGVEHDEKAALWWCDWAISKGSDYATELRAKLSATSSASISHN